MTLVDAAFRIWPDAELISGRPPAISCLTAEDREWIRAQVERDRAGLDAAPAPVQPTGLRPASRIRPTTTGQASLL